MAFNIFHAAGRTSSIVAVSAEAWPKGQFSSASFLFPFFSAYAIYIKVSAHEVLSGVL